MDRAPVQSADVACAEKQDRSLASTAVTRSVSGQSRYQQDHLKTLIELWPLIKDVEELHPKWGDEIEYCLLCLNPLLQETKLSRHASHVIEELTRNKQTAGISIEAEAYQYMLETAPLEPFASDLHGCALVEQDMLSRRNAIQKVLDKVTANTTIVFTLSRFGMFGAPQSTFDGKLVTSAALHREAASWTSGPRYDAFISLIESRRGCKIRGKVELYNQPSIPHKTMNGVSRTIAVDDLIYTMGGCAMQVNLGMRNLSQALHIHDQFLPIGPLMLALTAASPVLRGFLISRDARWDQCSASLDDRMVEEALLDPRWGTSSMYLAKDDDVQALNGTFPVVDENDEAYTQELQQAGWPKPLATLMASTINRAQFNFPKAGRDLHHDNDFDERLSNLQTHLSSFWPHVRLKLPDLKKNLPWIVELRSLEVQPTDFENAAITVFLKLLQQTIIEYKIDLRIPIHRVAQNMQRAQVCNAVKTQKFWFKVPAVRVGDLDASKLCTLSLNEIFNGYCRCGDVKTHHRCHPGLLPYVRMFIARKTVEQKLPQRDVVKMAAYFNFIARRASGAEPTPAKWMRDYLMRHEKYRGDSRVTQGMYYDMLQAIAQKAKVPP